jgi:hypothetical protein
VIGALLVLLVVGFGAVTAWQVADRQAAAGNVLDHSAPLSANAAEIYRSLADADATVAGGFLVGGQEPTGVADQYQGDVDKAAKLIAQAAADSAGSPEARAQIDFLNRRLPVYTQLVATAQADNRQGLPLGGAYLRYADQQMRDPGGLLDAAGRLYQVENARLGSDYAGAKELPYAAWALGVASLAALVWAQRRLYRRTNRVFNRGLVTAGAATAVTLVWLAVGHTVARADLEDSAAHGARSVQVLDSARIAALNARSDETLALVSRGADSSYDTDYPRRVEELAGPAKGPLGGELARALELADTAKGRASVRTAAGAVAQWRDRHATELQQDGQGHYDTAVAMVIGGQDSPGKDTASTWQSFTTVDEALSDAIDQEHAEFQSAAADGRDALLLLPYGAGALALVAAACAAVGIGRRLAEYR